MKEFLVLLLYLFGAETPVVALDVTSHPNWKLLDHVNCGRASFGMVSNRIIEGQNSLMGEAPWFVALFVYKEEKTPLNTAYVNCGGVLLNSRFVITAGHCLVKNPINTPSIARMYASVGEYNTQTDPDCDGVRCAPPLQVLRVDRVFAHTYFGKLLNDIGMVHLMDPAQLNDFVKPICLPHGNLIGMRLEGKQAQVYGFGVTNTSFIAVDKRKKRSPDRRSWGMMSKHFERMIRGSGRKKESKKQKHKRHEKFHYVKSPPATILQKLSRPIIGNDECRLHENFHFVTSGHHICFGSEHRTTTCFGDSGSPLTISHQLPNDVPRNYLMGFAIFGCGGPGEPSVYTIVSVHLNWILDILSQ